MTGDVGVTAPVRVSLESASHRDAGLHLPVAANALDAPGEGNIQTGQVSRRHPASQNIHS